MEIVLKALKRFFNFLFYNIYITGLKRYKNDFKMIFILNSICFKQNYRVSTINYQSLNFNSLVLY